MQIVVALLLAGMAVYSVIAALRTQLTWARWRVMALAGCRVALLLCVAAWVLGLRFTFDRQVRRVEWVVLADRSPSLSSGGAGVVEQWIERARQAEQSGLGTAHIVEIGGEVHLGTPLGEAIDRARRLFAGRGEKRLVVISDGRQTGIDARALAPRLANENVSVTSVRAEPLGGEALVADLIVPASAWRSVPVPIEVLVRADGPVTGRLTLRVDGEQKEQRPIQLGRAENGAGNGAARGLTRVEFVTTFERDGVHHVEVQAEFDRDGLTWNNRASALVDVPLAPRVVIIAQSPASVVALHTALTSAGMQVRVVSPTELPAQFAADCIIVDNVPADALGDERLSALEAYVRGGGSIVFTGGPRAYAAGGYANTPLEPVFPVLLTPDKEHLPFALCVVLDNSWSMNEGLTSSVGKIDLAKEIAIAAVENLNRNDWLALVSFDSDYHNIIPPTQVSDLTPARYEISRIGAFGMTNIYGGLAEAIKILKDLDAAYRHIVLISDGKETETGTDYSRLLADMERYQITLSTVAVGLNVDERLMNTLSYAGRGRFYLAKSLNEIPAIVLQEAKGRDDELVITQTLPIRKVEEDPALNGVDVAALPPMGGYNRSRPRAHAWTPLVILRGGMPRMAQGAGERKTDPLLARMRYGKGQALAFLSSSGPEWTKAWIVTRPEEYATFWRQAVASTLGPPAGELAPAVDYASGWPRFAFAATRAGGAVDRFAVSRVVSGQVVADELGDTQGWTVSAGAEVDALLVTGRGRENRVFAWSRTWGREFDDPSAGVRLLRELSESAGGTFVAMDEDHASAAEAVFAPGSAIVPVVVSPAWWLALAVVLLVAELVLRRGPAVSYALKRSGARQEPPAERRMQADDAEDQHEAEEAVAGRRG